MTEQFITLKCKSCGGKLDVYDDMKEFACGYCGTEMIVKRRGGTIALEAVTAAIQKVQIGTDKTAAELAIVRLDKELLELTTQLNLAKKRHNSATGLLYLGATFIIVGIISASWAAFLILGAMGAGLYYLIISDYKKYGMDVQRLEESIKERNLQLADNKAIANA